MNVLKFVAEFFRNLVAGGYVVLKGLFFTGLFVVLSTFAPHRLGLWVNRRVFSYGLEANPTADLLGWITGVALLYGWLFLYFVGYNHREDQKYNGKRWY